MGGECRTLPQAFIGGAIGAWVPFPPSRNSTPSLQRSIRLGVLLTRWEKTRRVRVRPGWWATQNSEDVRAVVLNPTAYFSSISLVLGFLLVFRTQLSYGRYWEGRTAMQVRPIATAAHASESVSGAAADGSRGSARLSPAAPAGRLRAR